MSLTDGTTTTGSTETRDVRAVSQGVGETVDLSAHSNCSSC